MAHLESERELLDLVVLLDPRDQTALEVKTAKTGLLVFRALQVDKDRQDRKDRLVLREIPVLLDL